MNAKKMTRPLVKLFFKALSSLNKKVLPSYIKKDLTRLSPMQKAVVGYRLWVTKNYLDLKNQ